MISKKTAIKLFLFSLIVVLSVFSCVTVYDTVNNRNFSDQYSPGQRQLHPEYFIYMKSPDDVRLYFRIFPTELSFLVYGIDSVPRANARLFYRVTKNYSSTEIVDSLSQSISLRGHPHPYMLGYLPLHIKEDGKYVIEVFFTDKNEGYSVSTVLDFNYSTGGGAESFMFLSKYGSPLFYPHFSEGDTFQVRSDMFAHNGLRVSYYKKQNKLPAPPDLVTNKLLEPEDIDSSWVITNSDIAQFSFSDEGTYFFANNDGLQGKSFVCTNEFFPYLKTAPQLLAPLAYLLTPKEMVFLNKFTPKQAVDTFWLHATSNIEKSRELIRIYYNRVQLSNYYFTDYREGWLTDRGMIYIVLGAPGIIRKTDEGEYWIYGQNSNEATKFFFYREKHPVFGYIYILERSELYSRLWFNAVTTWRDGRVFSLNR